MPKLSSEHFREILKNNGYSYVQTSKKSVPTDINFPNMPDWHRNELNEWCDGRNTILPDSDVICFEYKGSNYKLLINTGTVLTNDGCFGALVDGNNDKILDVISSGDSETTLQSLKTDDTKISDDLSTKLSPYLRYFEVFLQNNTEFEYVVFKILMENGCLYGIDDIVNRYNGDDDEGE